MRKKIVVLLMLAGFLSANTLIQAADHGSPLDPPELWVEEARLTDLFAWPETGSLIVALDFFLQVDSVENPRFDKVGFGIFFDWKTSVNSGDPFDLLLYGGTVENPSGIAPTASLLFHLNNDLTLQKLSVDGLGDAKEFEIFVGKRADPFIFPAAAGKNVMSFVVRIPADRFPDDRPFLIWASSSYGDHHVHQVDHLGRALRSSPVRFQKLNFLPPSLHVEWIETQEAYSNDNPHGMRPFDYRPDVMIFDPRRDITFPNGRLVTNDIIGKLCQVGECTSYERSIIFGGWPRRTTPHKPLLNKFPYLPEPYENRSP